VTIHQPVIPAGGPSTGGHADQPYMEDVGFMTCMAIALLGNYAQTGHFGGPLAYTPFNVAAHLARRDEGGLHFDYRRPKHPYGDKFMLAAGHCAPTCYALWIVMGEALARKHRMTGDRRYQVAPELAMRAVDALGFRRGAGALRTLLRDHGLEDHPRFADTKGRGIRALSGHIESTDVTNDVNGGPSGVGIATAAGTAMFWDFIGAPAGSPKIVAFEGEFAMCAGHAQELKTQAMALQVGKRLRIFFSDNNAGIDDALIGGVVHSRFEGYRLVDQWTSYGWNVFTLPDGHDYAQILAVLEQMERWDPADRRPMIVVGKTTKGYWPVPVARQIVGYPSHPFAFKMNADYIVELSRTFEARYAVAFDGMSRGPVTDPRARLIQFKTNMDVVMSVLEQNGLGDWLADRLVE
jgi:transketolase N-terminal domain/subunit